MSVDDFLVWAEGQPTRHELADGHVVAMAPERARHAWAKLTSAIALLRAVARAGVPCHVLPDGVSVRFDASTAFAPDAIVYCGEPLDGAVIEVPDPTIVVEILSPRTRDFDSGPKLTGHFQVRSLRHDLIVDPETRVVMHHRRGAGDLIETRVVGFGTIVLAPPGIEVAVDDLTGAATPDL